MTATSLSKLVRQNLRRNWKHNLLSVCGVAIGVAALTFFLALDQGVRKVVLGDIFPVDLIEVIPAKSSLLGSSVPLTDKTVRALKSPPSEVGAIPKNVFARAKLALPARGWGGRELLRRDRDFYFELSGFCDGVDPGVVDELDATTAGNSLPFVDWETAQKPNACGAQGSCPTGYYCAWDVYECHRPVPALISRYMIELYNSTLAVAHPGLPKIPSFAASLFRGQTFTVEIGRSYLGNDVTAASKPIQRRFQLVGVNDKAIDLGVTVPLNYVRRWNAQFSGKDAAATYSSMTLIVSHKSDITPLVAYVKSIGLDVAENQGEKVGLFITLATALLTLISAIIVLVSALNIAHTFMMLIADRRREIGVFRAIGATESAIQMMILVEAAVLGCVSGVVGIGVARLSAFGCDWYSARRMPDFPFKPDTYFSFDAWLLLLTFSFAVCCCLIGAIFPARRAAKMDPAAALTDR